MSGRLLVDDNSSCRCSCTNDWYSAVHVSSSLPLVHPFSKIPSKSLLNICKKATSCPPIKIALQKQLKPCHMSNLGATVENRQFTNSSGKRRASRRKSVGKFCLPVLSGAVKRRVPGRKFSSSIAGNRDCFGFTYFFTCSTSGIEEAFIICWSRH